MPAIRLRGGQGGGGSTAGQTAILSGAGAPAGTLGIDGDFYINTTVWTIYGPKTTGAWGSPTSLIGAAGADGTAGTTGVINTDGDPGTTIYVGTIDPDVAYTPVTGDVWLDTNL